MPRNMSFSLTTDQVRNQTKTVTRRTGWRVIKPGDIINACVKCMGLKKGDKVEKICQIHILSTRWEPLHIISDEEVIREGFPDMTPKGFVEMFCKANKCRPDEVINRIEFEYI